MPSETSDQNLVRLRIKDHCSSVVILWYALVQACLLLKKRAAGGQDALEASLASFEATTVC